MHTSFSGRPLPVLLLAAFLCLVPSGCRSHMGAPAESLHPALPADLILSRSVVLQRGEKAPAEAANVTVSDNRSVAGGLQRRIEQQMADMGFEVTPKPSQAGRIITLIVLHRGPGGREEMESSVRSGYGGPVAGMRGTGSVLVADLLLVRRRVPTSRTHLSNASAANAVGSSQVRLGLYSSDAGVLRDRGLEEALSREIASLAAYVEDSQVHSPSSMTPIRSGAGKARKKVGKSRSGSRAAKAKSGTSRGRAAKSGASRGKKSKGGTSKGGSGTKQKKQTKRR